MFAQHRLGLLAVALVLSLTISPAQAQKAKDTLRIAFPESISGVSPTHDLGTSHRATHRVVFETLVYYDDRDGNYKPMLAQSWKRIDPRTWEFKLRRGIKFHDGSAFDATMSSIPSTGRVSYGFAQPAIASAGWRTSKRSTNTPCA